MVYGDKRPNLVGILVPDPEWAAEWAEAEGLPKDMKLLREHEKFRTAIRAAIDRVNGQLSVIEKVRKFDFADEPFGIENEQMTPSMKIRQIGRASCRERVAQYVWIAVDAVSVKKKKKRKKR